MVEIESRDKATCGDCVLLSVMFQRNPPKPRKIHPFAKKAKYTS